MNVEKKAAAAAFGKATIFHYPHFAGSGFVFLRMKAYGVYGYFCSPPIMWPIIICPRIFSII